MSEQKLNKIVLTSLAMAVAASLGYAAYTKWELIGTRKEIDSIKSNEQILSRKIDENAKHVAALENQISALKSETALQKSALDAFQIQANVWEDVRKKIKTPS